MHLLDSKRNRFTAFDVFHNENKENYFDELKDKVYFSFLFLLKV